MKKSLIIISIFFLSACATVAGPEIKTADPEIQTAKAQMGMGALTLSARKGLVTTTTGPNGNTSIMVTIK